MTGEVFSKYRKLIEITKTVKGSNPGRIIAFRAYDIPSFFGIKFTSPTEFAFQRI